MANARYVSHGEFSQFREDVRGQFAAMQADQTTKHRETLDAIEKLREKSEPQGTNWGVLLAAFGVITAFLAIYVRPLETKSGDNYAGIQALSGEVHEVDKRVVSLEAGSKEWDDAREERHDIEARVRALETDRP